MREVKLVYLRDIGNDVIAERGTNGRGKQGKEGEEGKRPHCNTRGRRRIRNAPVRGKGGWPFYKKSCQGFGTRL